MRCLALAPVAAVLAACQPAAEDPRGVDRDETLLTVSATGESETRPNEARFALGVQSQAASAREASRLNNEKMQAVMTALRTFGVEPNNLQTRELTLNRIDYGRERGQFRAYNVIEVRLEQVDRAGDAITAASEAGANVLRGPQLVVADREAASRSAYAAAYRAARSRAETYADAAGLEIARVLTIRDGGQSAYPMTMDTNMSAEVMAPPPIVRPEQASPPPPPSPFATGLNRTQVAVAVAFALRPKRD